jgi:hypothetical protein
MNSTDKHRLTMLCSAAGNGIYVVFNGRTAYTSRSNMSFMVNLSEALLGEEKCAMTPDTLRTIIKSMPDTIVIKRLSGFKYKFSSCSVSRVLTMVDAEESQPMPFSNICDEITITNPLEFSKCISFTSPFASEKDFLSSIFLETNGMSTDIIAMDGFSLAFKKYTQKLVSDEMKWLISKDHIQTVINFFSEDGVKAVKVERDTEGKIRITSEIGELVLLKCTHDYRDFKKNIDAVCPIRTDGSLSENAAVVEVDTEELKKALSHVISMYVRNEYPSVDILIEDNLMRVDTEVTARGYDCFRAEIPVEKKRDNDRYRIQTSPVIMLKALNRYKGKVRLIWTKDADPQKNPICLSQTKTEMVLFTPKSTVPKEDREYE